MRRAYGVIIHALIIALIVSAEGNAGPLHCQSTALSKHNVYQNLFYDKGPSQQQWLGGDNANSIPLGKNLALWTFGDSYWGRFPKLKKAYRTPYTFTHDAFGIFNKNKMKMEFYTKKGNDGVASSFLTSTQPNHYYWILSGTRIADTIVLGLVDIISNEKGFKVVGTAYATVENSSETPVRWRFNIIHLSDVFSDIDAITNYQWSASMLLSGEYLYVFGSGRDPMKTPGMRLARIKKEDVLESHWEKLAFLMNDKGIKKYQPFPLASSRLKQIEGLPSMSEASFYYDKGKKKWYTLAIPFMGKAVSLYASKRLEGPWENKGVIYDIPAPWSTTRYKGKALFLSYAPKIHPEFIRSHPTMKGLRFVFSYINNLNEFELPGVSEEKAKAILKKYPGFYLPLLVNVQCH